MNVCAVPYFLQKVIKSKVNYYNLEKKLEKNKF